MPLAGQLHRFINGEDISVNCANSSFMALIKKRDCVEGECVISNCGKSVHQH